jgi:hypothetical protein
MRTFSSSPLGFVFGEGPMCSPGSGTSILVLVLEVLRDGGGEMSRISDLGADMLMTLHQRTAVYCCTFPS